MGGRIVLQMHNGPGMGLGVSGLLGYVFFYLCSYCYYVSSTSKPPIQAQA